MNIKQQFYPNKSQTRLKNVGNLKRARKIFYKKRTTNLNFLLQKRYLWMNEYIKKNDLVIELGCGAGFSKEYIRKDCKLILTDINDYSWLDKKKIDAMNTGFKNNSIDIVIVSNSIHHFAHPKKFFEEIDRILKKGGKLLIQDVSCSIAMQLLLLYTNHEGWDFTVDPYNKKIPCNDKKDPWSGNNALVDLLFSDKNKFYDEFKNLKIIKDKYSECIIFPLSGGVIAKKKVISVPYSGLKIINIIDNILVRLFPKIFALQRKIVLEKR